MENGEQKLMVALTLGAKLTGKETAAELQSLIDKLTVASEQQDVLPLQEDLAEWLSISLQRTHNRKQASQRLWERIQSRGYTLVDVPTSLRRQCFGGSLDIQKRLNTGRWKRILFRKLRGFARTVLTLIAIAIVAWVAWRAWEYYQAVQPAESTVSKRLLGSGEKNAASGRGIAG